MKSPCIGVCKLDKQNRCIGCHRTRDEIAAWRSLTDEERSRITERCQKAMHNEDNE